MDHQESDADTGDIGVNDRGRAARGLMTVPLHGITLPGVYVTERGDLLRVASEFMARGRIPILTLEDRATRLSVDPRESIAECRRLAASADLPFNF